MIEFSLDGNDYRAGKLDAFKQFHVSRKIGPIIPTLVPLFVQIAKDGNLAKDIGALAPLLQPFADGLAELSDEASEYVIATCLSVVSRRQGEKGDQWASVWSQGAKACMFDDMDLGVMIQIVIKVLQDSLAPFIRGLLISQQGEPK